MPGAGGAVGYTEREAFCINPNSEDSPALFAPLTSLHTQRQSLRVENILKKLLRDSWESSRPWASRVGRLE